MPAALLLSAPTSSHSSSAARSPFPLFYLVPPLLISQPAPTPDSACGRQPIASTPVQSPHPSSPRAPSSHRAPPGADSFPVAPFRQPVSRRVPATVMSPTLSPPARSASPVGHSSDVAHLPASSPQAPQPASPQSSVAHLSPPGGAVASCAVSGRIRSSAPDPRIPR